MANSECIFCQMIAGKIPVYMIEETSDLIVILSLENHPLIIPKKHLTDIHSLDTAISHLIMDEVLRIANAVKQALSCDGIRIMQLNGAAAGQEVFHLHFHVIPRWEKDDQIERTNQDANYKQQLVAKIKAQLDNS